MPDASSSLPEGNDEPDRLVSHRSATSLLFDLAPSGVYLAKQVTLSAGELLPHHFTLTESAAAKSPDKIGGILSAALALTSRPVGVTDHPALRSPDFPLAKHFKSIQPAAIRQQRLPLVYTCSLRSGTALADSSGELEFGWRKPYH